MWILRDFGLAISSFTPSTRCVALASLFLHNKRANMRTSIQALLLSASTTYAQLRYGNNERVTTKDNPAVAEAFPEVEEIELLSPAFLRPESTPPGWVNGTDGPTSLTEMGTI